MNKSYLLKKNYSCVTAGEEDLKLINSYSQKELTAEEIFCFSVLLCDNEIDRDFERFTNESLKTLAELFVGKTAIKNHSMNSDDQSARTYKTEFVRDTERKNSLGEDYCFVKAFCYMPRLEKNAELIKEIESGIKKEVSVGCSVGKSVCSICGKDKMHEGCSHKRGKKYDGKLCYCSLEDPCDAYEWSFVAVPAQRNAGVTKSYTAEKEESMEDTINSLKSAKTDISLSREKAQEIAKEFERLSELAEQGRQYRAQLETETVKLFALTVPALSNDCTESICKSLSTENLEILRDTLKQKRSVTVKPQTAPEKAEKTNSLNEFRF